MPMYEIDFRYKLPEWGTVSLDASDVDEAEDMALDQIETMYADIEDVEIESIRELKNEQ